MRLAAIMLCVVCLRTALSPGQTTLPAGGQDQPRVVVLDACRYSSAEQAQAAWRPVERLTPPIGAAAGRLRLPCNFSTNGDWRVAWDRKGKWDLSDCQEISLTVTAPPGGVARMLIYLQSGRGWYSQHFVAAGEKTRIDLPRHKFGTEGRPEGWDRIETIRLCVQRTDGADSAVEVSDIQASGYPALVAVWRSDAGAKAEPGVPQFVRQMAEQLDRLGIPCEIMGDDEVAGGRLAGMKAAILPLNPVMPGKTAEAVGKFVAGGGKLLVCYRPPAPLPELLGNRPVGGIDGAGGQLSAIRFMPPGGRPAIIALQRSWTARRVEALSGTTTPGVWVDSNGAASALPAITANANGYFVAHVLTAEDQSHKDALLMQMLGSFCPELWVRAYDRRQAALWKIGGAKDLSSFFELTSKTLEDSATGLRFRDTVLRAAQEAKEAGLAMSKGDGPAALEKIEQAQRSAVQAYAASIPSKSPEFRAVWCHSPTGVRDMTWPQAAKALADAGFNAIIVNMAWGGGAAYPSKLLPAVPEANGRDLLRECLDAARANGLAVHVWKVNWNCWRGREFAAKMRKEGRLQLSAAGAEVDWLCPSCPENQALELESMLEIVRNYPVAGIHFDYIRYNNGDVCYCPRCRGKFEEKRKAKVADWPADAFSGKLRDEYRQFRRDNITELVAAVSEQARRIRKDVLISAAVFPNWPSARVDEGQDWKLWVERGYLDFVCPMQYTDSPADFEAMLKANTGLVGSKAALCPGIGATLGNSPEGTIQQVQIARRLKSAGFVLFNYDPLLLTEHLPLLRLGPTARKAEWPPGTRPAAP